MGWHAVVVWYSSRETLHYSRSHKTWFGPCLIIINCAQHMPCHATPCILQYSIWYRPPSHPASTTSIYIRIHPKIFRNFRPRLQMFRLDSPVVPPPDESHVLATRLGTIQHQKEHLDHNNKKIQSGHKSNSINRISPKLGTNMDGSTSSRSRFRVTKPRHRRQKHARAPSDVQGMGSE